MRGLLNIINFVQHDSDNNTAVLNFVRLRLTLHNIVCMRVRVCVGVATSLGKVPLSCRPAASVH